MKQIIDFSPAFVPAARTLNFSTMDGFSLRKLMAVINMTRGQVIYVTGKAGLGFTSFTNNILTLEFDTSTQSSGDVLQVLYDIGKSSLPSQNDEYVPIRPLPLKKWRTTFASAIASGVNSEFFTLLQTGSGQTVSQSAGNLVITSGTTANTETVIRSNEVFSDSLIMRWKTILSQRIANQNFFVELVDVIGDGLALTVNSATSITVTIPNNPFTSQNVGQSIYVGVISGVAGAIPGRYAIASVSGNNVTFTVAGWPASGSGTVSLFGWNYYQARYQGATATSVDFDAQRRGWNSGFTTATINTTASPGHAGIIQSEDGTTTLMDQLVASATGTQAVTRASRVENIPAQDTPLRFQLRVLNGSTAPASTTTWTIGFVSVEGYIPQSVSIHNIKPQSLNTPMPIVFGSAQPVSQSGTWNVGQTGTWNVGQTGTWNINAVSAINATVADVASAALTSSTTTAAITPTGGISYAVNIPVTAVSGTNPTLDVSIEESDDNGTNWFKVYDFPRITAVGMYRSPTIRMRGTRVRYVQTVGGTTPSFTRSINRVQMSNPVMQICQIIDRTIVPNTLNSVSPALLVEGCQDFNIFIRCTAQTTPATITLQFSDDNVNWHTAGNTLTTSVGIAHAKVANEQWKFARAIVSAAGTGITLAELTLKAVGK
jgi:hypothetical protein